MMKYLSNPLFDSLETRRLFTVDLVVTSVQVTNFDLSNGTLSYSIGVENNGTSDTPSVGVGGVVLSTDQVINNGDDILIDTIPASTTPAFSQNTVTGTVRIPGTTPAGAYYLGAALDINSQVQMVDRSGSFMFTDTASVVVPKELDLSFNGTDGNDSMTVEPGKKSGLVNITVNGQSYQ